MSYVEQVTVGPHLFAIQRFPVRKAMAVSAILARDVFGPAARGASQSGLQGETNVLAAIAGAAAEVFAGLSPEKLDSLVNLLVDPNFVSASTNGGPARRVTPAEFDMLNMDVAEVYELLEAVCRINFEKSISRVRSRIGGANFLAESQQATSAPT